MKRAHCKRIATVVVFLVVGSMTGLEPAIAQQRVPGMSPPSSPSGGSTVYEERVPLMGVPGEKTGTMRNIIGIPSDKMQTRQIYSIPDKYGQPWPTEDLCSLDGVKKSDLAAVRAQIIDLLKKDSDATKDFLSSEKKQFAQDCLRAHATFYILSLARIREKLGGK